MTALYSVLHMFVDGVCALSMVGTFLSKGNRSLYLLLYNFCAFALQMPIGTLLDILNTKIKRQKLDMSFLFAVLGALCTMIGAVTHPVILGIGNALFHVGGGVGTIREDAAKNRQGRGLGVFVAPGALGLYLGTMLAHGGAGCEWLAGVSAFMLLVCAGMIYVQWRKEKIRNTAIIDGVRNGKRRGSEQRTGRSLKKKEEAGRGTIRLAFCCLLVVIVRSYIGMAVAFPWKTTLLLGTLSVLAVVCGKIAGGFLAAHFGCFKAAVGSLLLASFCYLFSHAAPLGLAALFLFNMTMPITLYLLISGFPKLPGFSFGLLTFGLFLGFLPGYFEMQTVFDGNMIGFAGSVISLLILTAGIFKTKTLKDVVRWQE